MTTLRYGPSPRQVRAPLRGTVQPGPPLEHAKVAPGEIGALSAHSRLGAYLRRPASESPPRRPHHREQPHPGLRGRSPKSQTHQERRSLKRGGEEGRKARGRFGRGVTKDGGVATSGEGTGARRAQIPAARASPRAVNCSRRRPASVTDNPGNLASVAAAAVCSRTVAMPNSRSTSPAVTSTNCIRP